MYLKRRVKDSGRVMIILLLCRLQLCSRFYGKNDRSLNIAIQALSKETYNETVENEVSVMRSIRKDKPGEPDSLKFFLMSRLSAGK